MATQQSTADRTMTATTAPPLRADARRNRVRVLEAAQAAFAEEGLAVPLDEIARRAGVGAGTVYRHFPTKETLFEAVVLGRVERLVDYVRGVAQADDPGDAFYAALTQLVDQSAMKKDLVDALAGSGGDVTGALADNQRGLRDAIGHLLGRAQHAGAVRTDVGIDDLMVLLKATFVAAHQHDATQGVPRRALAVIRDGLRP